jgi:hypothetical protein
MSETNSGGGGIGILGVLFCVFVGLKLGQVGAVASWSWWMVTSPLWGGTALVLAIFLLGALWSMFWA